MRKIRLLFLLLICATTGFAQHTKQLNKALVDSATNIVWLEANFSYQFPVGDLANTFKSNLNIGTGFTYKTARNWTWSVDFNYMFGSKLSCELKDVLGPMVNKNGDILDGYGMKATLGVEGRYWNLGAGFGKIFSVSKKMKNSGIWINAQFGYLSHKIHFTDNDHLIDQLDGDYKKGYDRRSGGFYMTQFIGYIHLGKLRVASFYGGIEIYEMWTVPTRSWNFVTGATSSEKKFSALLGVKVGWIIPLYEQKRTETYYYR
ncbi:MAG: hypothetical protein MJZ76_01630 [Bacteroidales bacterium]|nr:hypothetical protein [Bacteroidales bacterium]